jgi:hypothetical protein
MAEKRAMMLKFTLPQTNTIVECNLSFIQEHLFILQRTESESTSSFVMYHDHGSLIVWIVVVVAKVR